MDPASLAFRPATPDDLDAVAALLARTDHPPLDPRTSHANLTIAVYQDQVVAAADFQVLERSGLLRFYVVAPEHRSQGLGAQLFRTLLSRAYELSLKQLFALTDDANDFLRKLGFAEVKPERVPARVRDSHLYQAQDTDGAAVLRLALA